MRPRYEIRNSEGDRWSVIDIFTGRPALVDGVRLTDKDKREAQALADALNTAEAKRYGTRR